MSSSIESSLNRLDEAKKGEITTRLQALATLEIETEAIKAELSLNEKLATEFEGRRYFLEGEITQSAVSTCIATLSTWRRIDQSKADKRIHIYMNASGPEAIAALALYDYIRMLGADGFEVTIEVTGQATGHAVMVLQSAHKRLASPLSRIVLEEMEASLSGHTFVLDKRMEFLTQVQQQTIRLTTKRTGITPRRLAARTKNTSWVLSAAQAQELGLIDEVSTSLSMPQITEKPDTSVCISKDTDARKKAAELRKQQALGKLTLINLQNQEASAANSSFHQFFTGFNEASCKEARQAISRFTQLHNPEITLLINSPGGSVVHGFGLIDLIKQARASGHRVVTECVGYAASMGGVTLQAGDWRVMSENSWLLIHNVSSSFWGTMSENSKSKDESHRLQRQCFETLAERSTMTADEIFEQCRTHDWWIPARQALKLGFIDEVR